MNKKDYFRLHIKIFDLPLQMLERKCGCMYVIYELMLTYDDRHDLALQYV